MQPSKKTKSTAVKCETSKELKGKLLTDYIGVDDSVDSLIEALRSIPKVTPCYPDVDIKPCYPDKVELKKYL